MLKILNRSLFLGLCSLILFSCQKKPSFQCPADYLAVSGSDKFETQNFCVMKYEARNVDGLPMAAPEKEPWVNITFREAQALCRELGQGYDLITNREWMSIAKIIESKRENWTGGRVGEGLIFRGHSNGEPFRVLNILNKSDPYDQKDKTQKDQRRVHYLEYRQKIWDFAGNTWSWVNWSLDGQILEKGPVNCINGIFEFRDLDLSKCNEVDLSILKDHNLFPSNPSWGSEKGMGQFQGSFASSGGAARRGGHRSDMERAGIYALALNYPAQSRLTYLGFRCVYRPENK